MENEHSILDAPFGSDAPKDVESNLAGGWKRFFNLIIDYAVVFLIFFLLAIFAELTGNISIFSYIENPLMDRLVTVCVYISYATIFETLFGGKTIGKFITRTRVVTRDGSKPSFINLLGKNLARLIPFDALSYLGKSPVGWHDGISNTRVIND